jgi:hypothetical protein
MLINKYDSIISSMDEFYGSVDAVLDEVYACGTGLRGLGGEILRGGLLELVCQAGAAPSLQVPVPRWTAFLNECLHYENAQMQDSAVRALAVFAEARWPAGSEDLNSAASQYLSHYGVPLVERVWCV